MNPEEMRRCRSGRACAPYLLLVLLSAALFVPGQASLPPFDRDESRYLQATAQMFETGNFVDIRFQDQPRYLQPAGIYWLQAASVALFSEPGAREVWAHRMPSLLGATAAVLLTAWIGNLLFGAPAGFVAAVLLAASVLLGVEARMAKIDAVLLAVDAGGAGGAGADLSRRRGREGGTGALGRAAVAGARRRADAEGADHPAGRARHGAAACRSPSAERLGCGNCGRAGACR